MNPTLINSILTASIPTVMVVLALLLQRNDIHHLRAELRQEIADLRTQQHNDMLRIYQLFGEHGERLMRLEARVFER